MTAINLIVWIFVYSICLVHITLFAGIYVKKRNKNELLYLIVIINIFLLAVIITLSLALRINNFIPVLVNCILTLYVTIPLWGYCLFNVDKKYFKLIPILVITEAVIENILLYFNVLNILFISRIVFYCFLTSPLFFQKENNNEKNILENKMRKVTKITVTLFVIFMASLIPFTRLMFEISYVSSLFWAVFTLSYQVPGLVYCINSLKQKEEIIIKSDKPLLQKERAPRSAELSSLSKRENEVAMAICEGHTYAQIAEIKFISLSAVKKHAYSIYKKLKIKNNRELLRIFLEASKSEVSS